jgi:AcrR family transcriptional regulator
MVVKLSARTRILNACRKLFVKEKISYPRISISDICENANVGRKTFYRYFKNKDDAIFQLIENDVNGFGVIVDEIISLNVTPLEKIDLLNKQILKSFTEDFTAEVIEEFRNHFAPEVWEFNAKKEAEVLRKFCTVIQEGIDNGSIRGDINPDIVLFMISAAAYSLNNKVLSPGNSLPPSEVMDQSIKIIFDGIIKKN